MHHAETIHKWVMSLTLLKDITTIVLQRNADQNHNETLHHWGDENKSMYNYKHWQRYGDWKAHSSIRSIAAATLANSLAVLQKGRTQSER